MKIVDFQREHAEAAQIIAKQNYNEERGFVPALPDISEMPDLTWFADNNLGVAALEGKQLVGFLCCTPPFGNAFRSTDAVGVFSPMGANGAIGDNRADVYARMYQAAGERWARVGAASHAICLYAHDKAVQEQFFRYGFGIRCIDAIRELEEIPAPPHEGYTFTEINSGELPLVLPLVHMLDAHMAASPSFILRTSATVEQFTKKVTKAHSVIFAVKHKSQIVAYLRFERDGETFITEIPGYLHVMGAYCLPEHRGNGMYSGLLNFAVQALKAGGYTRLGVDFDSFNPTAYGFWLKHFDAYTRSVVRRIDEHAVSSL